jgi:urease accessory protein
MWRAISLVRPESENPPRLLDSVTLDRQSRFRRRVLMETDGGHEMLLDLAEPTYLGDGDLLQLSEGGFVKVVAAAEPLLEIRATDAMALARIAWHLGNRHTPAEVTANAIYIQPDHVLAEMIVGLGGEVRQVTRPFDPEGGAYGGKGSLHASHHHGGDQHGDHEHSHQQSED